MYYNSSLSWNYCFLLSVGKLTYLTRHSWDIVIIFLKLINQGKILMELQIQKQNRVVFERFNFVGLKMRKISIYNIFCDICINFNYKIIGFFQTWTEIQWFPLLDMLETHFGVYKKSHYYGLMITPM